METVFDLAAELERRKTGVFPSSIDVARGLVRRWMHEVISPHFRDVAIGAGEWEEIDSMIDTEKMEKLLVYFHDLCIVFPCHVSHLVVCFTGERWTRQ
jgi:hypothetical protein